MTATFQTPQTGIPPAGPGPLRLVATTSRRRRRQRRQPLIQLSWRVMLPDGRTLGWVQLVHIRDTGRSVWGAAAAATRSPRC